MQDDCCSNHLSYLHDADEGRISLLHAPVTQRGKDEVRQLTRVSLLGNDGCPLIPRHRSDVSRESRCEEVTLSATRA